MAARDQAIDERLRIWALSTDYIADVSGPIKRRSSSPIDAYLLLVECRPSIDDSDAAAVGPKADQPGLRLSSSVMTRRRHAEVPIHPYFYQDLRRKRSIIRRTISEYNGVFIMRLIFSHHRESKRNLIQVFAA